MKLNKASHESIAQCLVLDPEITMEELGEKSGIKTKSIQYMRKLVKRNDILERVEELKKHKERGDIVSAFERKRFLSAIIKDPKQDIKDRIKAAETLDRIDNDPIDDLEPGKTREIRIVLPDNGRR